MDNSSNKLISVQICTYNRANLIKEAIQSVLDQTYENFEIVIIDDASTDNTEEVVKSFSDSRIKYFKNEKNLGIAKNRNIAVQRSSGKYIAILDSDDLWNDSKKLEKQIRFLEENLSVGVIGTQAYKIDLKGNILGKLKKELTEKNIRKKILSTNQFVNSSVLIRKKIIEEFGGYDESLSGIEDYDLFLKIGQKYQFQNLASFSTSYRTGHESYSSNRKKIAQYHLQLVQKNQKNYPNYIKALLKSYLRLFRATF
ncbi:MAG: glycosyltransferase family 2 protein [Candidatus Shapirobacteria bacterium]|nr:glycosyltransferase family 2 protein [Candidatus Shapirobacteria bacterium]